MSTPKSIYSQSEARRLRDHPCPHCGKTGRISKRPVPDMADTVDPQVSVLWYCLDPLCNGHDGFSIENQ
jgi:hypothetical protein